MMVMFFFPRLLGKHLAKLGVLVRLVDVEDVVAKELVLVHDAL